MILTEGEIRKMVTECVARILEYHHVIDSSLEKLAEMIIEKFNEGGGAIPHSIANSLNPYFKSDKDLMVAIEEKPNCVASYEQETNTIFINGSSSFYNTERMKEAIMHELSHFVDQNMRTSQDFSGKRYSDKEDAAKVTNEILYYFRPTEMQARLVQYKYFLEQYPFYRRKPLSYKHSENVLHLDYMADLIDEVENEDWYYSHFGIVHRLAFMESKRRAQQRGGNSTPGFARGFNSEKEFNSQKDKIVNRLKKRLDIFAKKAAKIKYDMMSE